MQSLNRWRLAVCLLLGCLMGGLVGSNLRAQERAGDRPEAKVALVIGNASYRNSVASLKNPVNDANLMAQTLQKLGFSVQVHHDLDRAAMYRAVKDFTASVPENATSFVYFAGHGMQVGGASYLIPIDMELTSEQKIPFRAVALKAVLESMSATRAEVNIVVLDACRNNPFQPASPVKYRSLSNLGLATIQAPKGTLVAYSTAPNQRAPDGQYQHSIYTATLAAAMLEPGVPLIQTMSLVGERVRRKTHDDQIPWFESSLVGEYFLLPAAGSTASARQQQPLQTSDRSGPPGNAGRNRGVSAPVQPWFRDLDEREWTELDYDIQQRVVAFTPDGMALLEHQARGGNVLAQTTLGLVWREGVDRASTQGKSVTRFNANNGKSLYWLEQAAAAGFPIAQIELAEMLYRGRGTARNTVRARSLAISAASANYPRAKWDVVQMDVEDGMFGADRAGAALDSAVRAYRFP